MNQKYSKPKVLFIGGSVNQTSICHAIAKHLTAGCDCYFTPYYVDSVFGKLIQKTGLLDFTVLGGQFRKNTDRYLQSNKLPVDYRGERFNYDLVVTTSDLVVQKNIRSNKIVLVQEGMTDPENLLFPLVRKFKLPPYLTLNTSAFGLSDAYDYFCVASNGYRQLFINKGVNPQKIVVTGIPNFDDFARYLKNDFPYHGYLLAATSDLRETKRLDNRNQFIRSVLSLAGNRKIIFKLHPNEKVDRAVSEIKAIAPEAIIYSEGNTNHMVANCDILVTQYSSVTYMGIIMGKQVYSYYDTELLRKLAPIQNGGHSGKLIANVCKRLINRERKAG